MRVPGDTDLHPGARVTMSDQMMRCPDSRAPATDPRERRCCCCCRRPTPTCARRGPAPRGRRVPGAGRTPPGSRWRTSRPCSRASTSSSCACSAGARRGRRVSTPCSRRRSRGRSSSSAASRARTRSSWSRRPSPSASPPRRTSTSPRAGPENLTQLHHFLSDTVLLTGHGFDPPAEMPNWGRLEGWETPSAGTPERVAIGVLDSRTLDDSGATPLTLPRSRSSTTARTTWPGTPRSSTPCAARWSTPAGCPSRCSARRCAPPRTSSSRCSGRPTSWSPPCSPPAGRSPRRPARARTTRAGTPARSRRSTSRSCRPCA